MQAIRFVPIDVQYDGPLVGATLNEITQFYRQRCAMQQSLVVAMN
jgi:hypothetical protein